MDEYDENGLLMRHHFQYLRTDLFNVFGDVIATGDFSKRSLNGEGCKYIEEQKAWFKSPHFKHNHVYGLCAVLDEQHNVIFYGYVYKNQLVKEHLTYHPFLHDEYMRTTNRSHHYFLPRKLLEQDANLNYRSRTHSRKSDA